MTQPVPSLRVGVDIGGTFTDLVILADDGRVFVNKVPSTVDDYGRAIVEGLSAALAGAALDPAWIGDLVHGTTVASNAILERRGARTGLITTQGFRDILEIRRLRVPRLYDLTWEKPPPLVERALRVEVDERINASGQVVRPLDQASLERAVARLLAAGVEAIAVCLINSYANPAHEQAIKAYLTQAAPGRYLSISAEVLPEIREYERTSTTVINAYVMPVIERYLRRLRAGLATAGVTAPLLIMQSNGGVMSAAAAAARPIAMIESGPAAGVVAARALSRRVGLPNMVTVDIGGTTAKAAMIEAGEISRASEYEVGGGIITSARLLRGAGYLLRAPTIDLAEVGAGGGSLIWLDRAGALQIGPQSAGALPGPVCYDLGGVEPTATDANVVLGYINPEYLAGGSVRLRADLAERVIAERVAAPLGRSLEAAAYGAHLIAAANMNRAIRAVSSERGRDPRDYVLCAFGGNGPVFAAAMARALEMRQVVIPPMPGLFSSFGLLCAEIEHHLSRSWLAPLAGLAPQALGQQFAALEREALAQLRAEGYGPERVVLERAADLHYHGQSFELTVPVPGGDLTAADLAAIADAFGREHERTYGHRAGEEEPVELVSLRLVARGLSDRPRLPDQTRPAGRTGQVPPAGGQRRVYFGPAHGWLVTPVLRRDQIDGAAQAGPLIVEEYDATTVVPPDAALWRDAHDNLRLDLR